VTPRVVFPLRCYQELFLGWGWGCEHKPGTFVDEGFRVLNFFFKT